MFDGENIFVTGGAGTLGRALAKRWREEGWGGKFTVYSTDDHKHDIMRKMFPEVRCIQGDIRNSETLYCAMLGHDIVVHAAAVKVIPVSEHCCMDTYSVNVEGSLSVFSAAVRAGIESVISISTDKACYPVNAYGCSKMMMEKIAQEYSRIPGISTNFHTVRYGNVLESTGSVIEAWKRSVVNGEKINITDPSMTRFWISPADAVQIVVDSLSYTESGEIFIPRAKSLSIGKLAEYTLGKDIEHNIVPLRPGEKTHECLLTSEETHYADIISSEQFEENHGMVLRPTTTVRYAEGWSAYTSDTAPELTKSELEELLTNV